MHPLQFRGGEMGGGGYDLKPYGGLTFLVIEGNLSFEEGGARAFSHPMGAT